MIEGHGNDIYNQKHKIIGDFSSNVVYTGVHKKLETFLRKKIHLIANYPDPRASILKEKISVFHHTNPENILVTNGSAEAFYLTAHLFAHKQSLVLIPSFAEYEDACRLYKHAVSVFPVRDFNREIAILSDLVWIGIPNNPDGAVINTETIEYLCAKYPKTYFVIDNAYAELCSICPPLTYLHKTLPNLISIHSLTKTFAIPGMRIGYMIATTNIIEKIKLLSIPWNVNALAIEAGKFIFDHYNKLLPPIDKILSESIDFQKEINNIHGLKVFSSNCNFFLVQLQNKTSASDLKKFLLENYALLIRDASNFHGLNNSYFRLAVQSPKLNQKLIAALTEWTKHNE